MASNCDNIESITEELSKRERGLVADERADYLPRIVLPDLLAALREKCLLARFVIFGPESTSSSFLFLLSNHGNVFPRTFPDLNLVYRP